MTGEDRIFLLQLIHAVRVGGEVMAKFLLDKDNIDRTIRIKESLGKAKFDEVLEQMKEVIYATD
jgi:hypothetical protein